MNANFRKIDIDQYDEDALQDSEVYEQDPRNPADVLDDAKQRQIAVRGLLARFQILLFRLMVSYPKYLCLTGMTLLVH
jgi:actin related protein 2/3 complex subunit 5